MRNKKTYKMYGTGSIRWTLVVLFSATRNNILFIIYTIVVDLHLILHQVEIYLSFRST